MNKYILTSALTSDTMNLSKGGIELTVQEIATLENVHVQTVRGWIKQGKLKAKTNAIGYDITEKQYDEFCSNVNNKSIERRPKK